MTIIIDNPDQVVCPDGGTPPCNTGGGSQQPTGCPPGQVPKSNGQGCKPSGQWWDDSPDELSKKGEETCTGPHPGLDNKGRPGPEYDCYWCDFDDRQWKRGYCPQDGGGGGGGAGAKAAPKASNFTL